MQAHDTQRHVLCNGAFSLSLSLFICLPQSAQRAVKHKIGRRRKKKQTTEDRKIEGKQKPKQTQNRITTQYCCRRWNGKTSEEKKDTWWFQQKTGTHCVCTVNYTFCCILYSIQQQKNVFRQRTPQLSAQWMCLCARLRCSDDCIKHLIAVQYYTISTVYYR